MQVFEGSGHEVLHDKDQNRAACQLISNWVFERLADMRCDTPPSNENTQQAGAAEQAEITEQAETTEQAEITEQAETTEQAKNTEQVETTQQAETTEQVETTDKAEITEQAESPTSEA